MTIKKINNAGYVAYIVIDPKGRTVAVFDSYAMAVRCATSYTYYL